MAFRVNRWTLQIEENPAAAKASLTNEWVRAGRSITNLSKRLGISRQTLYSYFTKLGIDLDGRRPGLKGPRPALPKHSTRSLEFSAP